VDLLLAELLGRLRLVLPLEVAVVPLVQGLVALDGDVLHAHDLEHDVHGLVSPREDRGVDLVEVEALEELTRMAGFFEPLLGEGHVDPSREAVLEVPLRLAVAKQNEGRHRGISWDRGS